jgi:hypothetical protein
MSIKNLNPSAIESPPVLRWGKADYPYPGAYLGSGNRCGHDPKKPEHHLFNNPGWASNVPFIMAKLIKAVEGYYDAPMTTLPSVANLSGKRNKDGFPRQNRSERRIAQVLVAKAIIYCLEFATLRVGTPLANGEFKPRSCAEIAAIAGMLKIKKTPEEPDEPSPRFWRAFRSLRLGGAFDVYPQYDETSDGKRARPAIKRVHLNFLIALGAVSAEALDTFRIRCRNRLNKKRRAFKDQFPVIEDAKKARTALRREQGESGIITHKGNAKRAAEAFKYDDLRSAYQAEQLAYQAHIVRSNPTLTAREASKILLKEFPSWTDWLRERQNTE